MAIRPPPGPIHGNTTTHLQSLINPLSHNDFVYKDFGQKRLCFLDEEKVIVSENYFFPAPEGPGAGARKNLHLCRVGAFENPHRPGGASGPDFGSHYLGMGLQAPASLLAPSGYSIGSSKGSPVHEHCRGLCGRCRPHRGTLSCRPVLGKPVEGVGVKGGRSNRDGLK
jgi:hypothetical protein